MSFLHRLANSICQTPLQQLSVQVLNRIYCLKIDLLFMIHLIYYLIFFCKVQQVRTTFVRAVMYRDYRRRQIVKHYAKERLRINSLRKNSILPSEIQVKSHHISNFSSLLILFIINNFNCYSIWLMKK